MVEPRSLSFRVLTADLLDVLTFKRIYGKTKNFLIYSYIRSSIGVY